MIRYVVLLRRAQGVDREQFLRVWLGEHQEMARKLPGVLEVGFHPTVSGQDDFDGVGYLEFGSTDDLNNALESQAAQQLRAHTATFSDPASTIRVVVDTDEWTRKA